MVRNPKVLYKVLVVGVIVLFIGVGIQPIIANVQSKEIKGKSLPDLIITQANRGRDSRGFPYFRITIQNCGDAPVQTGTKVKVQLTLRRLFLNNQVCFDEATIGALNPEAKTTITMGEKCIYKIPGFFPSRIILEVDTNYDVMESNEQNNLAWAFMLGTGSTANEPFCIFCNYYIGRIRHQKSFTTKETIDITNLVNVCPCLQE